MSSSQKESEKSENIALWYELPSELGFLFTPFGISVKTTCRHPLKKFFNLNPFSHGVGHIGHALL
jgi:hypothetical protein